MTFTREFFIPTTEGVRKVEDGTAVVYLWEEAGKILAKGFSGKRAKPVFFYRFSNNEKRQAYVDKFFADTHAVERYKADAKAAAKAKKAELNAAADFPVGTVVVSSGGYEQTNVSYFKVVGHFGRLGVKLVPIGSKVANESTAAAMSCYLLPDADRVTGEEFNARVSSKVSISNGKFWGDYAQKHDGRPDYCSWYG